MRIYFLFKLKSNKVILNILFQMKHKFLWVSKKMYTNLKKIQMI